MLHMHLLTAGDKQMGCQQKKLYNAQDHGLVTVATITRQPLRQNDIICVHMRQIKGPIKRTGLA